MPAFARPLLCILIVVLLTTWGTCPCVFANMLSGVDAGAVAAEDAPAPVTMPCCCKLREEPLQGGSPAPDEQPEPGDDDCPCCANGGWMRDLPPQASALQLDAPDLSAFELPVPITTLERLESPSDTRRGATDPPRPSALRPHAAPVGIVRLLN